MLTLDLVVVSLSFNQEAELRMKKASELAIYHV